MLGRLLAAVIAVAMSWGWIAAWGQAYPSRPVRIIVPFGPSIPDSIRRITSLGLLQGR